MSEDRSLDDFVGADASDEEDEATVEGDEVEAVDDAESEVAADDEADTVADDEADTVADTEDADSDEAIDGSEADESESVDPPSITATWATDGIACDRCDAEVERRWECDGDYVCADCKDW